MDDAVVAIRTDSDIVEARQRGRMLAEQLGFSRGDSTLIATAISEVARNIVTYAHEGQVVIAEVHEGGRIGVSIVATDRGPGIADLGLAMQDGFSTGRSLGLGLPGARRLVDEFEIESTPGQGTTIRMKKWRP